MHAIANPFVTPWLFVFDMVGNWLLKIRVLSVASVPLLPVVDTVKNLHFDVLRGIRLRTGSVRTNVDRLDLLSIFNFLGRIFRVRSREPDTRYPKNESILWAPLHFEFSPILSASEIT